MKYINTLTGRIIDAPCEIKGAWQPYEEKKPVKKTKKGAKKK